MCELLPGQPYTVDIRGTVPPEMVERMVRLWRETLFRLPTDVQTALRRRWDQGIFKIHDPTSTSVVTIFGEEHWGRPTVAYCWDQIGAFDYWADGIHQFADEIIRTAMAHEFGHLYAAICNMPASGREGERIADDFANDWGFDTMASHAVTDPFIQERHERLRLIAERRRSLRG